MGKSSAPEPEDPIKVAEGQTATNIGTAITQQHLNNINQVTPEGSLTFSQSGQYDYTDPLSGKVHEVPTFTATQTYSPVQQAIFDEQNRSKLNLATMSADQSGKINDLLSNPFDVSSLQEGGNVNDIRSVGDLERLNNTPDYQSSLGDVGDITRTYGTDFSADRQKVEDELMGRLDSQFDRDRVNLEQRLADQGIRVGSEAYTNAMGDHNSALSKARTDAILSTGQEQSRLTELEAQRASFENQAQGQAFGQEQERASFGNNAMSMGFDDKSRAASFNNNVSTQETNADLSVFDAKNAARNQALEEEFAVRNQPINEITALMSGSQVSNPNFITPQVAKIANTDYAGIEANYTNQKSAAVAANNQQVSDMWNTGMQIGTSAAMAMSDRRTKENIEKVGKTEDGHDIYKFRYKSGGPMQMGVMAQDVEKKKPSAVKKTQSGMKMVDYSKIK